VVDRGLLPFSACFALLGAVLARCRAICADSCSTIGLLIGAQGLPGGAEGATPVAGGGSAILTNIAFVGPAG